MTINKSQGQSLKGVVLYLPQPVFTDGQLYVGLSRVTTKSGLKIIQGKEQRPGKVKNIVYKEIYNRLTMSEGNSNLVTTLYPIQTLGDTRQNTNFCFKSWSGLPLTRPGPRPAQYLEDGGTAEA